MDKLFLQWTEFNPDANLGFFIPPSIVTAVLPDPAPETTIQQMKNGYGVVRLYTEKLLVALPTPDFSMPYNVICLACTVVAIAFGSVHNLTTKIFVEDTKDKPTLVQRIKAFFFPKKETEERVDNKGNDKDDTENEEEPEKSDNGEKKSGTEKKND